MDFLWLVSSEYKSPKIKIMHPIYTSHSGMGHRWGPHTGEGERTACAAAVTFHTSPLCSWGLLGEQRRRPPTPTPQLHQAPSTESLQPRQAEENWAVIVFRFYLKQRRAQTHKPEASIGNLPFPVWHLPLFSWGCPQLLNTFSLQKRHFFSFPDFFSAHIFSFLLALFPLWIWKTN